MSEIVDIGRFVAEAICEIRRFNSNALHAATDYVTGQQFTPYQPLPIGEAARGIVVIDGLWQTQVFREKKGQARMLRLYEQNLGVYRDRLDQLRRIELEAEPEAVSEAAAQIMETLLEDASGGKKHYSFATKLFHWHAPHHLPIVDSRACKAIQELQREWDERRDMWVLRVGTEWAKDYPRWIEFYTRLLRKLPQSEQDQLLAADRASLPSQFQFARPNTLLRVLDKAFYQRGGE